MQWCSACFGGRTERQLQIPFPQWRTAVGASLVSPEQDCWQAESQQLLKIEVMEIASYASAAAGCGAVLLSNLIRWTACHRFSELAVFAAPQPSLMAGSTASQRGLVPGSQAVVVDGNCRLRGRGPP